ncbi:hypothetical protein JYU13_00780 [Gammaproteobacteria bacterium AH-315-M22]|nr:hypothetical protein [Gammaproteobacteria bacterium AH-315-M22]
MIIVGFFAVTVASCGLLKSDGAEYAKSTTDIPLQVPKDLQEPNRDSALIVPEETN